jgi:Putative transposase
MSMATLPPSNHLNALRAFVSRIRRMRSLPSAREMAHGEESMAELDGALGSANFFIRCRSSRICDSGVFASSEIPSLPKDRCWRTMKPLLILIPDSPQQEYPAFDEFLRRFLLHLLPRGFMRIRNFGFLANRRRASLLPLCFQLLAGSADIQASFSPASDCERCSGC